VNVAYKHLDSKLRILELTIGQWLCVLVGLGAAILWAYELSPFGLQLTLISAIYIGALPAGAVLFANFTEFDLWLLVRSAAGWRRLEGRFAPGPGDSARGYVLVELADGRDGRGAERGATELDLAALWEES
jgi:hypothetical protein